MRQIMSGVSFIHDRNIIHLNLTPANIIFRNKVTEEQFSKNQSMKIDVNSYPDMSIHFTSIILLLWFFSLLSKMSAFYTKIVNTIIV